MGSLKDLKVYQKAFQLALDIYEVSKAFPPEEKYGLTSQVRRSSRSVCACMAEGYRKRNYEKHFVAKISDADMENTETQVWLDFGKAHGYLDPRVHEDLIERSNEIGRILDFMMENPEKFRRNN